MKKLFFFLALVISLQSYSQQPTGMFPYSKPQNSRGIRYNGFQAEVEMYAPLKDTNWMPAQAGNITFWDTTYWGYNGFKWIEIGVGSGIEYLAGYGLKLSGYTFSVDSNLLASRLRLYKVIDSIKLNYISGLTQTGSNVKLGGALLNDVTFSGRPYGFYYGTSSSRLSFINGYTSGGFYFEDSLRAGRSYPASILGGDDLLNLAADRVYVNTLNFSVNNLPTAPSGDTLNYKQIVANSAGRMFKLPTVQGLGITGLSNFRDGHQVTIVASTAREAFATTFYDSIGAGAYTLPIATASILGGVKVGSGLAINSSTGVLSNAFTASNGLVVSSNNVKLGGTLTENTTLDVNGQLFSINNVHVFGINSKNTSPVSQANIGINLNGAFDKREVVLSADATVLKVGEGFHFSGVVEYTDNAAAVTAGLTVGTIYRTGDLLKIVH